MRKSSRPTSYPAKGQIKGQLSFDFIVPKKDDRNLQLGGRSFYFFDFDDNVAYLSTPIILFHKKTGAELQISSGDFAENHKDIGKTGKFADYIMEFNDEVGSFRNFRDKHFTPSQLKKGVKQTFVEDIEQALNESDTVWKAPSWNSFFHATYNQRPVSLISSIS